MSEQQEFRRGSAITSPALVIHIGATLLLLNGVAHLIGRQWAWGAIDILFAAGFWLNQYWTRRTPIIRVADGEMVVSRHQFVRPRRIDIRDIQRVDDSRPSTTRLVLQGGREVVIPLHWIEWDDRSRLLSYLKSVAGMVRR